MRAAVSPWAIRRHLCVCVQVSVAVAVPYHTDKKQVEGQINKQTGKHPGQPRHPRCSLSPLSLLQKPIVPAAHDRPSPMTDYGQLDQVRI